MSPLRVVLIVLMVQSSLIAADAIPHAQDKPPNEPRDPQTAAKMMTVPEGFVVEVVAAEPDIVNPVAMAIDERGRFWITESLEYPRREPGVGRDRVKILEDTDGDGKADKFTVFLDGLNIPSGVQVGHGGVWIANSPDILFVPDADRDGVPDGPAQVVVTGFGRTDTHELPNSLTWGPDGWLYGLNGVFNHSHVKYTKENPNYDEKHPGWPLTCAMFRIHPRTREFQVFCEGTSNPWGIAFNDEGDAFVSACVIDHLWHLVETGYYHRQGGPYPPHTWKIDSIVKHKHQKAAYCGITWFDSDAYPEKYRKKLYMGNIHGGCINVDRIERNGSTYAGFGEPDFLTANDAWFMPVVQKTGPDGCLYILDWYDRYHCYQDANRDPKGIDRLKGRLYRVRYEGERRGVSPTSRPFDLANDTDEQLIEKLGDANVWTRETAQRLLQERNSESVYEDLLKRLMNKAGSSAARRHMTWTISGMTRPNREWYRILWNDADMTLRSWAVRTYGDDPDHQSTIGPLQTAWLSHSSPSVRLQATIAVAKAGKSDLDRLTLHTLAEIYFHSNDVLIQRIAWQNLHPLIEETTPERIVSALPILKPDDIPNLGEQFPRFIDRILARRAYEPKLVTGIVANLAAFHQFALLTSALGKLREKIQTGELKGEKLDQLRKEITPVIQPLLEHVDHPSRLEVSLLALSWNDRTAAGTARSLALNPAEQSSQRLAAYQALISSRVDSVDEIARVVFERGDQESAAFRGEVLAALGKTDSAGIGDTVVRSLPTLPAELQPKAIELLTQRPVWAKTLLKAVGDKKVAATAINVNQARRLYDTKDTEVRELLAKHWGQVREGRSPDRDKIIAEMRSLIRQSPGDAMKGEAAFKKVCAQCHKLYGEGAEVGPDITLNGRNDYTQLLSNVFDPSLVIGAGYRSYTVVTVGGRVINGLLVEESPQRIVLKVQGGKQEIIPRDDIDEFKVSEISLMPEQLEKQLSPQEIIDLFAYITLDKPPHDPTARRLSGVYDVAPRSSESATDFAAIFQEVAPGFTQVTSGEGGVALLKEHMGRPGVVRTHPISRDKPADMSGKFAIPAGKKTTLLIDVSHDPRGDWRLVVSGPNGRLLDEMVSKATCKDGWATFNVDLSRYAGQETTLRMWNQANDWSYEFAYWGSVRMVNEP
ncbi:MAG TPA: PVC-type heme-binding CxxCH protein [Planctomycetaceae bacterium]|nr:PVC-type heme-binding CxxCH protein [Planctomycetaceae bacterium]